MKRKSLFILLACVLAAALIVPFAVLAKGPPDYAKDKIPWYTETQYSVMSPRSWFAPFEATPLNPRLDTLEGKHIGIVGWHHEPMQHLQAALEAAVPGINITMLSLVLPDARWSYRSSLGVSKMRKADEAAVKALGIDAVIQGIAH